MRWLFLVFVGALPAAADPQFSDFTGDWDGRGSVVRGERIEALRCRLSISATDVQLDATGRCATPAGGQDVVFTIREQSDGTLLADGLATAPDVPDLPPLSGARDGDLIALTGPQAELALWRMAADALRMKSVLRDGDQSTEAILDFARTD